MSELVARYEIHPNLITNGKKRVREGMVEVFKGKADKGRAGTQAESKELYAKIGELTVEKDFCPKCSIVECEGQTGRDRAGAPSAEHPQTMLFDEFVSFDVLL